MRLTVMKPIFRIVTALVLLGILALICLVSWRFATRPIAIDWPVNQIRSQITEGMPRNAVLELLGPPHLEGDNNHYFYFNSYRSREARHRSETPSTFSIFFENDRVDSILSVYDY